MQVTPSNGGGGVSWLLLTISSSKKEQMELLKRGTEDITHFSPKWNEYESLDTHIDTCVNLPNIPDIQHLVCYSKPSNSC